MESKLTDEQMEMLYDAASKDEASKIEVYKMFTDCSNYLDDKLVCKFVKRLDATESSLFQARDIDLIFNFARTSYKGTEAKESAIFFLYQIATNLKQGVSMSLLKPARKHLQELLKNQSQELKEGYICRCLDRIQDEQTLSVQSIKILINLIKSMPKYNYSKSDRAVSQKEFVRDLVKHQGLISIFIRDLAAYKLRVKTHLEELANAKKLQKMAKKTSQTDNKHEVSAEQELREAELFEEGFTHAQNIEARLKAILFTLETCEGTEQLQRDELQSLWDILTQNQVLHSDRELFFRLLKIVISEKNWIDTSVVCELFETKIQGNVDLLANVQLDSFNCIQAIFLIINESQNSLNIISQPKEEQRFSSKPISRANQDDKAKVKLEIRVHLPPQQLTGIEVIWEMFRHTNRSQDIDLQANIIFFLALVHQSLSRLLWSRKKEIYHQFTTECLQNISTVVADPDQHHSVKEELVKNTMYMLKEFFQASEKRGTACIRPHGSLEQPNRVLKNILFVNLIATSQTPKHIVMSVNCQTTVWELIDTLAKKVNRSPLKIKLQRDAKKPEITVYHFCKSLLDLKFDDSEEINIVKQVEANGKVPLINPQTGQLVREVEEIFGQWFDRFSLPAEHFNAEDYDENSEARYMTKQTCVEFLTHTVAELNNIQNMGMKQMHNFEENKSINELFSTYDADQDGRLTKADFLKFYTDKSNSAPDKVWQNLIQHEIGRDLLACPKREPTYENDVNVVRDQTELPRYLISSQAETLDFLFNLGQQLTSATTQAQKAKEAIWKLISSTKTNPQLYLSLLKNEGIERLTDSDQPIHKQLYLLQILQSFINAYSKFGDDSPNQIKLRCYYDAKKSGSKTKTGWNADNENFPTLQEPEKGKKFGTLQMQSQGVHKGDNQPPPLESIEEAREPDHQSKQRNLEGNHWQGVNVLPNGNVPIALPAGEPQDSAAVKVTTAQGDTFKYESNTKDSYYRQVVNQWKGDTQDECFECDSFTATELIQLMVAAQPKAQQIEDSEEAGKEYIVAMLELEEMKRSWLLNFIKKGGFQVLLSIMTSIVTKYATKDAKDTLNQAAEVEVLQIVTYMIRVILISCFCAQTQDQDLSNNLQRKLSSVNDEEMLEKQPKSKENQHMTKQTVITQQFKDLIGLLSEDQTTSRQLLETVDFHEVHKLIDLTLETILKKQSQASNPEKAIVAECLNIFISCVSFNSEMLNEVFRAAKTDARFYRTFILQGLLGDSIILRAQFKDALLFIADNVKHRQLDQVPTVFFLENLVTALEEINAVKSRNTSQFFQLLTKLIVAYFKNANLIPVSESFSRIIDPANFTKRTIQLLFNYESCETKNSIVTDFTLVGLLKLSRNLLLLRPGILSAEECGQTLNILVTTFLFNQSQDVITGHIRKTTNVHNLSQSQSNRCHTIKSREAAYSLMDAIISTNNDPEIINSLFETFWAPYIMQLSLQKDNNNYSPEDNNRASTGFVGLKNLANICYMNSVIQQMFNVPAFRYSLLAADDRGEKQRVEHEGRQIVDNYLYQWMRMFAFLSMSDRKEYNPKDFCFSHKQPGGAPTNVRVQMDAQEFINMAFDKLENSLKNTPQKYLVQNIFQGQTASLTICRSCGNINQNEEDFYCLTLNVRGKKTLYNSLESMVQGEIIEGYQCNACNQKTEIEKKLAIKNLPNTLIVHLNRITFDLEQLRNIKINDKLEFPNTLNVKKYMVEEVHREQRRKIRQKLIEQRRKNLQQPDESDEPKPQQEDSKQQEEVQIDTNVDQDMRDENADRQEEDEEDLVGDRKLSNEDCEFKLVGVVIHMGVAEAGHYLSYINIEREGDQSDYREWLQTNKQNWLIFNDSTVSPFEFSRVADQCFGEDGSSYSDSASKSHNAYMLIYEKAIKQPMKIVCDEQVLQKIQDLPEHVLGRLDCQQPSLACDSTAISRGNPSDSIVDDVTQLKLQSNQSLDALVEASLEWLPHSFLIYPDILRRIHQGDGIVTDEKTKEKLIYVPFTQVDKFVPQDFFAQVHKDNQLFLAEKQVMCNAFFRTTAFLLQQVVKQTDSCEDYEARQQKLSKVFTIIDKIIFEMIANGSEMKHLKEIQDLLFMVLDRSERSLLFLIEERILVGTKKTEDKKNPDKPFFDMLVFNKQQEVREMAEQILSKATLYLYERLEDPNTYENEDSLNAVKQPLNLILDTAISMMPLECMKAWHKLGAYFGYLLSLVRDGNAKAISDLNERKTVSKLVSLVTKFKEQQAYETSVPPFDKLVLTISAIVRSQPLVIYLNAISEAHQPTYADILAMVEKLGRESPYYKPTKPEVVASEHVFLKGDDLRAVMMVDKKPKEFYTLALKYTQEADEVSQLMGHICFNNYFVSRNIGKILLKGLNHVTEIELAPFLNPMGVYLTIDDQYQQQRIEWLCGLPDLKMDRPQDPHLINDPRFTIQKIGLQRVKDIEDLVFDYKSLLFREFSAYKESILAIIYNYRKEKFPKAMLLITDALFKAMVNKDRHQLILKYLLTIEPPAYAYRRYFDWFEPHFIAQIQKLSENLTSPVLQEEFEMSLRVHSNIEKLKSDHAQLFKLDQEDLPDFGGLKCADPYLVWNIASEKVLVKITNADATVHGVLHELTVNVTKSRPTGTFNDSLTRVIRGHTVQFKQRQVPQSDQRQKWGDRIRKGKGAKQEKEQMRAKRAQARESRRKREEEEGSEGDIDGVEEINTVVDESGETLYYQKVGEPAEEPEVTTQPQNSQNDGNEEICNWQTNLNQMDEDIEFDRDNYNNPEPLDFGNKAVITSDPPTNIPWPSQSNQDGQVEANNQDATGVPGNIDSDECFKADYGDDEEMPDDKEKQIISNDPRAEQDIDEQQALGCVMVLVVRNFNKYQAKHVRVEFPLELRAQMNWHMPSTDMSYFVSKTTDKTTLSFVKKRLHEDWGPIDEFKLFVEDQAFDGTPSFIYERDYPELRAAKKILHDEAVQQAAQHAAELAQTTSLPPDSEPAIGSAVNLSSNEKECPICTYINAKSARSCEMCESPF